MCEMKETICDPVFNPSTRKEKNMGKGVLSYDITTFAGRMLCCGHDLRHPTKKKKAVAPKLLPFGYKCKETFRELLAKEDNKRRELAKQRVRFIPPYVRAERAMLARGFLPNLGFREVRRYRQPCTVVIPLELEEDGYILTSSIVYSFIHYNEYMHELATKGSPFYEDPPLADQPEFLQKLADDLKRVEEEARSPTPNFALLIDWLLEMAVDFMNIGVTLSWIAEKLLLVAADIASEYRIDGFRRLATARFLYGYFLTHLDLEDHSLMELEEARCLSLGKPWTIDYNVEKKFKTLYLEVTDLISQALLTRAQTWRVKDPRAAQRYCSRALRLLSDQELEQRQAELVLELGLSYMAGGEFANARKVFTYYVETYTSSAYSSGLCIAYLEGAMCYTQLGNLEKAHEFLYNVLDAAEKSGLDDLAAIALRYIGESFLRMGFYKEASKCLTESFELFRNLNLELEANDLRLLAAISKGCELMPLVSILLNKSIKDRKGEHMKALLMWRLRRKPFWNTESKLAPVFPDDSLFYWIYDEKEKSLEQQTLRHATAASRESTKDKSISKRRMEIKRMRFLRKREKESSLFGAYYNTPIMNIGDYDKSSLMAVAETQEDEDIGRKRTKSLSFNESMVRKSRYSEDGKAIDICTEIADDIFKDVVSIETFEEVSPASNDFFNSYIRPSVVDMYGTAESLYLPQQWKPLPKLSVATIKKTLDIVDE